VVFDILSESELRPQGSTLIFHRLAVKKSFEMLNAQVEGVQKDMHITTNIGRDTTYTTKYAKYV